MHNEEMMMMHLVTKIEEEYTLEPFQFWGRFH